MRKFIVTVSADNSEPIFSEEVNADDPNQAMYFVLEQFKFDSRVMDQETWTVAIQEVPNA